MYTVRREDQVHRIVRIVSSREVPNSPIPFFLFCSAKAAAAILAEAVPNPVLDAATTDGETENSTVIKAGEKHPPAGKLLDRSLASFSSADRRGVSAGSVGRFVMYSLFPFLI